MDEREHRGLIEIAVKEAARMAAETISRETLARIDERVNFIRTIDLEEIKTHLEKLNGHVEDAVVLANKNKVNVRALWFMMGVLVAAVITGVFGVF